MRIALTNTGRKTLHLEIARNLAEMEPHRSAWDDLAAVSSHAMPMTSGTWQIEHRRHRLEPGADCRALFLYHDDTLIAAAPFFILNNRKHRLRRRFLQTPHSTVDLLIRPGWESRAFSQICRHLKDTGDDYDCVFLNHVPGHSPTINELPEAAREFNIILQREGSCCFLDVTGQFSDYQDSLNTKAYRNLRRLRRKLSRELPTEFQICMGADAHPWYINDFIELESSGWKGQTGTAIGSIDSLQAFFKQLVVDLYDHGWLRWHFLKTDERLIAAQMTIQLHRTLYIVKVCFDENFARYSPGNMLLDLVMEKAFEDDNIDSVNFITCPEWLNFWNLSKYPYFNIFLYPKKIRPTVIGYLPHLAVNSLKIIPGFGDLFMKIKPRNGINNLDHIR